MLSQLMITFALVFGGSASAQITHLSEALDVDRSFCVVNGYGSHYYSTDDFSVPRACNFERLAFKVYSRNSRGLRAIYMCMKTALNAQQQFLSNDSNCEGHSRSGVLGYVQSRSRPGHTALYRYVSPNTPYGYDVLTTIDPSEGPNANYQYIGIIGYAPRF